MRSRLSSREHAAAAAGSAAAAAVTRRRVLAFLAALALACVLLGSSRSRKSSQKDWARSRRLGIEKRVEQSSTSSASSASSSSPSSSSSKKPSFCLRGPDLPWPGAHHLVDDAYGPETAPFASCASIPGGRRTAGGTGGGGASSGTAAAAATAATGVTSSSSSHPSSSSHSPAPSSSSCHETIHVPTVALMFLTRGPLPFEAVWREWLLQARGMLPLYCVAAAACANGGWDEVRAVRAACGGGGLGGSEGSGSSGGSGSGSSGGSSATEKISTSSDDDPHLILGQHLFRVYTHAPPSFPGYPRGSIFRGTLIDDRLSTTWGDHSMVEATRRLLRAALLDDAGGGGGNQKFMLLSEACAPIYHPAVVHQQLLHERLSRVDACAADGSDGLPVVVEGFGEGGEEEGMAEEEQQQLLRAEEQERRERERGLPTPRPRSKPTKNLFWERWSWRFEEAGVSRGAWRKSAQWWTLTREAATAVVRDTRVISAFAEVCKFEQDADTGEWRSCVADESYVPTLLAVTRKTKNPEDAGTAAAETAADPQGARKGAAAGTSSASSSSTKPRAHHLRYRHLTLASTTDCNGYVTATDWSKTGAWGSHPLTFGDGGKGGDAEAEVTPDLIRRLRRQDERYVVCDADAVTDLALRSYARPSEWPADEDAAVGGGGGRSRRGGGEEVAAVVGVGREFDDDDDVEVRGRGLGDVGGNETNLLAAFSSSSSSSSSSWRATVGPYPSIRKFGYVCPLFARKFAPQAAGALAAALADPAVRALGVPRLDLSRAGPAPASPNLSLKTETWAEEDGGGGGRR